MENRMDMELVLQAQNGETAAFDILINRYQQKIMRLVYRYVSDMDTASDLVQEIFFKVFRNLKRFKGESAFSTWIFRIAVNDCIDHTRRVKNRRESSLDAIRESGFDLADTGTGQDIQRHIQSKMERQQVRSALEQMNPKQQMVVVMKVYQDMTFDEISDILGEPLSTIKSRMYKALETLGKMVRRQKTMERVKT